MQDPIPEIIFYLTDKFKNEILAIYGIGSFFDTLLPKEWIKNDVDIIVITKTMSIPFEEKEMGAFHVFIGFNQIDYLLDKELYLKNPQSNYKWAIIGLKISKNRVFLYGEDISDRLPEPLLIQYDYDDLLRRSIYRLEKSLRLDSATEFSKSVFKYCFYICAYFDKAFHFTSIIRIRERLTKLMHDRGLNATILDILENCFYFRINGEFKESYLESRNPYITYMIKAIGNGQFHTKMKYTSLMPYLDNTFGGCPKLKGLIESQKRKKIV